MYVVPSGPRTGLGIPGEPAARNDQPDGDAGSVAVANEVPKRAGGVTDGRASPAAGDGEPCPGPWRAIASTPATTITAATDNTASRRGGSPAPFTARRQRARTARS